MPDHGHLIGSFVRRFLIEELITDRNTGFRSQVCPAHIQCKPFMVAASGCSEACLIPASTNSKILDLMEAATERFIGTWRSAIRKGNSGRIARRRVRTAYQRMSSSKAASRARRIVHIVSLNGVAIPRSRPRDETCPLIASSSDLRRAM